MDDIRNTIERLIEKCHEAGISPNAFLNEKILELEERKRILLTCDARWFNDNYVRYNHYAARVLGRALTDQELHGEHNLRDLVRRRLNPEQRIPVDEFLRQRLLTESKGRCRICGAPITVKNMSVDHVIPLAEGGSAHTLNLQALCLRCNNGKSDFFQETAYAAARPWYERRRDLIAGNVRLTPKKRFCVFMRDGNICQACGAGTFSDTLRVTFRVPPEEGGLYVFDNMQTLCEGCVSSRGAKLAEKTP